MTSSHVQALESLCHGLQAIVGNPAPIRKLIVKKQEQKINREHPARMSKEEEKIVQEVATNWIRRGKKDTLKSFLHDCQKAGLKKNQSGHTNMSLKAVLLETVVGIKPHYKKNSRA